MKINNMDFRFRSFKYFGDCGHGWLRVPYTALYRLGLARKVSDYSYQYGEWVYLEEDRDATMFVNTLNAYGVKYKINHSYCDGQSFIRKFPHYRCGSVYDNDSRYLKIEKNTLDRIGYF